MIMEPAWSATVKRHFGFRVARRHWRSIRANVKAVDVYLKPSHLWDVCHASSDAVRHFLNDLKRNSEYRLIDCLTDIHVLSVGDDVFVMCVTEILKRLHQILRKESDAIAVVDVSDYLDRPRDVHDLGGFRSQVKSVLEQLECCDFDGSDETRVVTLIMQSEWNVSTLFGILLDYPVSYWYDVHGGTVGSTGNCLSMVPLKVFQVCAYYNPDLVTGRKETQMVTLYSFSIPEGIACHFDNRIHTWFARLRSTFEHPQQKTFTNLSLDVRREILAHVVL